MISLSLRYKLEDLTKKPGGSFMHIPPSAVASCDQVRKFLARHNTRKNIRFSVKLKNDIIVWVIDRRMKEKPVPPPKPNPNPRKYKSIKEYYNANRKQSAVSMLPLGL